MDQKKDIFSRAVAEFIDPDHAFEELLFSTERSHQPIVKLGVDPTRPDIHLGHAVLLRKLRTFQDLGAKVVFLIGDFTAMIGDPTGKSKVRPEVSQKEVEDNMKTYLEQVGKILDLSPEKFSWIRNSDWFTSPMDIIPVAGANVAVNNTPIDPSSFVGKAILFEQTRMQVSHLRLGTVHNISLINVLSILKRLTHARLIERDMFQDRMKKGEELYLHELLYPVFQAIDSHVIAKIYGSCDVEVGGTDQTFNMLLGRDVMKLSGQRPQAVLALDLLRGTDGKEKMSKSLNNYIGITDAPSDMYGKVMSVPDSCIVEYATLATFTPKEEIDELQKNMEKEGMNPRDAKMQLARQIVAMYHGEERADAAEKEFIAVFQGGSLPQDIPEYGAKKGEKLANVLIREQVLPSKTLFRRYIDEGAISTSSGEKIKDPNATMEENMTLKIGKKTFVKIIVS